VLDWLEHVVNKRSTKGKKDTRAGKMPITTTTISANGTTNGIKLQSSSPKIKNIDQLDEEDQNVAESAFHLVIDSQGTSNRMGKGKIIKYNTYYILSIKGTIFSIEIEELRERSISQLDSYLVDMWIEYDSGILCLSLSYYKHNNAEHEGIRSKVQSMKQWSIQEVDRLGLVWSKCEAICERMDTRNKHVIGGLIHHIANSGLIGMKNISSFNVSLERDVNSYTIEFSDFSDAFYILNTSNAMRQYLSSHSGMIKDKKLYCNTIEKKIKIEIRVDIESETSSSSNTGTAVDETKNVKKRKTTTLSHESGSDTDEYSTTRHPKRQRV
jgi:hypothetical protein